MIESLFPKELRALKREALQAQYPQIANGLISSKNPFLKEMIEGNTILNNRIALGGLLSVRQVNINAEGYREFHTAEFWENHRNADEVFYIEDGKGLFVMQVPTTDRFVAFELSPGECILIPRETWHIPIIGIGPDALRMQVWDNANAASGDSHVEVNFTTFPEGVKVGEPSTFLKDPVKVFPVAA